MDLAIATPQGPAVQTHADLIRALPRRVIGFSTIVETAMDLESLRASLEELAAASAFKLDVLEAESEGPGEMGRMVRAEFALNARRGGTGDLQIFALLREIAGRHRWNGVVKHLER